MKLIDQIDEMAGLAGLAETLAPEVSGWTVGQQIFHCCLTIRRVTAALSRSGPEPAKPKLTTIGRLVLTTGRISRGRGTAPAAVVVDVPPSVLEVRRIVEKARASVGRFDQVPDTGRFKHPYFGVLDMERSRRFLEIHNEHHLAIIKDILACGRERPDRGRLKTRNIPT